MSESKCEVPLQQLLNKTCESILKVVSDTIGPENPDITAVLYLKWGFDGSSGHSGYKQKFVDTDLTDTSVFISSLVPLRLGDLKTGQVLWRNPKPSSIRFCRPIRIQWLQETTEVTKAEEIYITEQINALAPLTTFDVVGSVEYSLMLTMVDGKVCLCSLYSL